MGTFSGRVVEYDGFSDAALVAIESSSTKNKPVEVPARSLFGARMPRIGELLSFQVDSTGTPTSLVGAE